MEIRLINKHDDRLAISRIYETSWKSAYRGIVPQAYLDGISPDRWVQALDNPAWHTLIMLDGNKIIGTSSYSASRFADMNGYGEIISIYFLPEYLGKGYGKQLLHASVDGLIQIGYTSVFLWVLEANTRAQHFYKQFGFKAGNAHLDEEIGGERLRQIQYIYRVRQ